MKFLRILAIVVIAVMGMTVAAQDFPTTFTTSDGLSIGVPEGFEAQEMMPGAAGVLDPINEVGVLVLSGAALESSDFPTDVSASGVFDALNELASSEGAVVFEGEPTELTLANGTGFMLEGDIPDFGPGILVTVDTEFGLLVALILTREGVPSEEFIALATDIIGSVTFDPSAAQPTEEPTEEPAEQPTEEPTDVETVDSNCPLNVSDMPENTIQTCLGVEFQLIENWSLFEGTETVDNYTSFGTKDFGVTAIITVNEISSYFSPEIYKTQSVIYMAESMGDTAYDAETSWTTVLEEEGRLVEVYDPREVVEFTGTSFIQLNYLVTLNNDLFVSYTFSYMPDFAQEADVEAIEGIVLSTVLNDTYTGAPVFVEVNGENVFVYDLSCGDSTYYFTFNDAEATEFVVRCPICEGTEGSAWGTDVYTNDSSVCLAAAHAGSIELEVGGLVLVTLSEGLEEYVGSEANGVTTADYGAWSGSFSTAPFTAD